MSAGTSTCSSDRPRGGRRVRPPRKIWRSLELPVEGGDRHDRRGRRVRTEGAEERAGGEVEDPTVRGDHEVAVGVADHADDGLVQWRAAHGALEGGVAEGEDPPV